MPIHMKDEIRRLEKAARRLEPEAPLRHRWNQQMISHADDFLDTEGILYFVERLLL